MKKTVERQVVLMHYAVFLEDWGSAVDQSTKWTCQSKERAHLCVSISFTLQAEAIIVTVWCTCCWWTKYVSGWEMFWKLRCISKSRWSCSRFETTLISFKVTKQNGILLFCIVLEYSIFYVYVQEEYCSQATIIYCVGACVSSLYVQVV